MYRTPIPTSLTFPEAELLMRCRGNNAGWLSTHVDRAGIYPYQASYGALGLVAAYRMTGQRKYLLAAMAWVRWYADNLPGDGFMVDWNLDPATFVFTSLGTKDSTDAYIGMWLTVLWDIWKLTGDFGLLAYCKPKIEQALTSLATTQQSDGLTWALPTYTAKYLEDNLETLIGLRGLQQMAAVYGDAILAGQINTMAAAMGVGIAMMWNTESQNWDWAIDGAGTRTVCDWSNESSRRQHIWSIAYDATPVGVRVAFVNLYTAALPNWSTDVTNGYEMLAVVAMQKAGLAAQAATGYANLLAAAAAHGYAYPFAVASMGQSLLCRQGSYPFPALNLSLGVSSNLLGPLCDTTMGVDSNADGIPDGYGSYITQGTGVVGAGKLHVATSGAYILIAPACPVVGGAWYCWSAYSQGLAMTGDIIIKVEWWNPAGLVDYAYVTDTTAGAYSRRRLHFSRLAPAAATYALCSVGVENGEALIDSVQFEHQGAPTAWVHG